MSSELVFKIDHREQKLKELLRQDQSTLLLTVQEENLAHGDFQLCYQEKPVFIFERKRLDDLEASIKDGRYKNQKSVLLQSGFERTQIYYIIEGSVRWSSGQIPPMIKGAIINTLLRDKINVFFTVSLQDTKDLLVEIVQRFAKDPSQYTQESTISKQIVTLSQNDKITPTICFRLMLCQIPGISSKSADAIVEKYTTMKHMMRELEELSPEDIHSTLSSIKVNGRKISSKIVQNLISYLFSSD